MSFSGKLYQFQEDAVERMIAQQQILLAMEMGLGKTICVIAAVERLIEQEEIAAGFVICPASLKLQWQRMIEEFAPDANVIVVSGDVRHRQDHYRDYVNGGAEYLILNPEIMVSDWEVIHKLPRDYIVCDEAQWFKNFTPKRSKKIKRLRAKYHWALTGQPIENRCEEVFSLMQWVDPAVLGNFRTFDKAFIVRDHWGRPKLYKNLPTLHRLLSESMVRHTRAQVADQLPAVTEQVVPVELDAPGARLYRRIVHDLETDLAEALNTWGNFSLSGFYQGDSGEGEARGQIMSKLMALRMICDSPELLRISAGQYRGALKGRGGSAYAQELHEAGRLEGLKRSPKLDTAVELITDILEADPANKVVVFSFFKAMLDLLAAETSGLTKSVIFSGSVSQQGRDLAKQTFANDPECRLFLSSDAGGIGLDLPQANYLLSFDLPWSAGAFAQRQSRIIRLSSVFPQVTLLSLQVSGSIDEYQYGLLAQKQRVADAVVDGRGISHKGRLSLDLASLSSWLATHET